MNGISSKRKNKMGMYTKRFYSGCYGVSYKGHIFSVEQDCQVYEDEQYKNDTSWMLCEYVNNNREYWNHFATKKLALEAIKRQVDSES